MNYKYDSASLRRILVTCAAMLAASVTSVAQTIDDDTEDKKTKEEVVELNPFIVNTDSSDGGYRSEQTMVGSRTSKSVMEIPTSLSIITKQQIEDLGAVQVSQVLQFGIAGVTQNQTINDDVNIRGFRTTTSMRNGVTKASYKRNPMFDVERVEVFKGPGAMLLGNNSFLGGGVNLVTIKPTHTPGGSAEVAFSRNNTVRVAVNSTGPLIDGDHLKVDYRATVGGLRGDRDKEFEEDDQIFVGGGLAFYFGTDTSLLVNAYYFRDNGYFYWNDFLDYNSTTGTTSNPKNAVIHAYSTKEFSAGRSQDAFWDNQDAFWDFTFLTKLTDNTNLRLYYFGGNLVDRRRHVRGIFINSDNTTLRRQDIPLSLDAVTNNMQGDLTHKYETSAFTLDSTAGFDFSIGDTNQGQSVNNPGDLAFTNVGQYPDDDAYFAQAVPGAGLPNGSQRQWRNYSFSYYFQENLSLFNDKLILVGGLRWFHLNGWFKRHESGAYTENTPEKFRTHKYGVVIRPTKSISVYYTDAANIFPQNGFQDRFQSSDQLGPPLDNQEGIMEEYGVKFDHEFNETFSMYANLAHYDMALTNIRTFGVLPEGNPPGSTGIVQSAMDSSTGWELEYGFRVNTDGGHLQVIGSYMDAESVSATGLVSHDFVPKKTSLLGKYSWDSGPLEGAMFGASYFDQTAKRNSNFWVDFPATYNVFAGYKINKNWSAQVNLQNVTDERYVVAIAANGLIQTEPGFDGRLTIKYKW